jgi:hypothetical protein
MCAARAHVSKSSLPVRRMPEMPSQFSCARVRHVCRSFEHEVRILSKHEHKTTPSRRGERDLPFRYGPRSYHICTLIKMPRAHEEKDAHANGFFRPMPHGKKAGELNACT